MSDKYRVKPAGNFGADPEVFLRSSKGLIVPSRAIVPEEGVNTSHSSGGWTRKGRVVRDGIQIELQPSIASCRQLFAVSFEGMLRWLWETLEKKTNNRVEVCLEPVVEIEESNFALIDPEDRVLGCKPSFNIYDPKACVEVDGLTYRTRSAGGHIHLDLTPWFLCSDRPKMHSDQVVRKMVGLCDIFLGTVSVLLDRHPLTPKRREVYGRAGEYRLPDYGIEYRTCSNFWLRSPVLMSLMTGLARLQPRLLQWKLQDEILSLFDPEQVRRSIDQSDLALAEAHWETLKKWITERFYDDDDLLGREKLRKLDSLIGKLDEAFPVESFKHAWTEGPRVREGFLKGW